ncbi:hypothetical protein [Novipirellula artificiosorum]|uniref:Uncharacterized protein n=1 Tax=Novipirellula artificiosorum TaxID=2528016 RepID=A0A5C6DWI8_9BACT|nr:hypothetical protein [Novipirellula artificiosorum]TWU40962.1 hypothetical protein Poly41_17970 [Novipirellula artificiosorum]
MKSLHVYLYGPNRGPIPTSFEEAASRLELHPRLHFEPDGSFVWSLDAQEQVFGMLYDAQRQLQYVDLQGTCRLETWQQLVAAVVGGSVEKCMVMVIPTRELQDLPSFQQATWGC